MPYVQVIVASFGSVSVSVIRRRLAGVEAVAGPGLVLVQLLLLPLSLVPLLAHLVRSCLEAVVRRRHLAARQVPGALEPAPAAGLVAVQPAAAGAVEADGGHGHVVGAAALLLHGEVVPPPDDHHPPRRARVRVPAHAVVRRRLGLRRRHPPLQPAPPHVELRLLRPRRPLLRPAAAAAPQLLREGVGEGSLAPRGRLDPALDPHP
uniref:Uncharacterized protein n=1 Tax=Arundo donax TaxID=35708 RepID=A0A0A9D801_ARUDO